VHFRNLAAFVLSIHAGIMSTTAAVGVAAGSEMASHWQDRTARAACEARLDKFKRTIEVAEACTPATVNRFGMVRIPLSVRGGYVVSR
jgi:hypothetical protein